MIIIASAGYIDQEFSSEFGLIPPAFLPVGNQCLFNHQIETLPADERIVLTVPASFEVAAHDLELLTERNIELLPVTDGLSLGYSLAEALEKLVPGAEEPLRILHGDTLIGDLPQSGADLITLSEVDGAYNWAVFEAAGDRLLAQLDDNPLVGRKKIANGYFAFNHPNDFIAAIKAERGSFIEAINAYARTHPIQGVEVQDWLDFGHIHTYYRSKARLTTERVFNDLSIGNRIVRKTSADKRKMTAEYDWFRTVPNELRIYLPQLVGSIEERDRTGYEVEYLYLTALNELFVFGRLPRFAWRKIFSACMGFLKTCRDNPAPSSMTINSADLFLGKTLERLEDHERNTGIAVNSAWTINGQAVPDLISIATETAAILPPEVATDQCVMHGDFCFSNILFDFRTESVRTIDPRGLLVGGELSIYGSQRYDIAKLAHSVLGMYDFIIAGYFNCTTDGTDVTLSLPQSNAVTDAQDLFETMVKEYCGLDSDALTAMQVQLFLSMLPLHADNPARQNALLANALRLYAKLD